MKEIWKDIPGYEGSYKISNLGKVQSHIYYNGRTLSDRARILKPFLSKGYLRVCLTNNDGYRKYLCVHRMVMLAFHGNSDLQVNHINGVKTDNRLSNLEYVTRSENMKHAYRIGLEKPVDNGFRKRIRIINCDEPKTFPSIRELCRVMKLDRRSVIRHLSGHPWHKTVKGYKLELI